MQKTIAISRVRSESKPKFSLRERMRRRRMERDVPYEFQEKEPVNDMLIPWAIAVQRMLGK